MRIPRRSIVALCLGAAALADAAAQDSGAVPAAAPAAASAAAPAAAPERLQMVGGRSAYPHGTCAPQAWPREALRYEIEGMVQIGYRIGPEGHVSDANVVKSSGWALLDAASVQAARTCTFAPDQAAAAQGRVVPVQFVWRLDGERVHPNLVPGSCVAAGVIDGFQPFDQRRTDATGVKVRFLLDADGRPRAVKLEGDPDAALAAQVMQHLDTCRFAFDPAITGTRTKTMTGRVLLR
jgi:TonB family protein